MVVPVTVVNVIVVNWEVISNNGVTPGGRSRASTRSAAPSISYVIVFNAVPLHNGWLFELNPEVKLICGASGIEMT